jgi:hypothetical protein
MSAAANSGPLIADAPVGSLDRYTHYSADPFAGLYHRGQAIFGDDVDPVADGTQSLGDATHRWIGYFSSIGLTGTAHSLLKINAAGTGIIESVAPATLDDSGNLSIGADTDILLTHGRTKIGQWSGYADNVCISHYDQFAAAAGLRMNASGWIDIVSAPGTTVSVKVGSTQIVAFAATYYYCDQTFMVRNGKAVLPYATGQLLGNSTTQWDLYSNVIRSNDGTVSAPAYRWHLDGDTGLYRIGNDNPGMACGGALIQSWSTGGSAFNGNVSATGRYYSTLVPDNSYGYSFQAQNTVSWTGTADTGLFGGFTSYFNVAAAHAATNLAHQMFRLVYAKQAGAVNPAVAAYTQGVMVEYDFNESESAAVDGCSVSIDVDTGKTVTTFAAYRARAKTGSGTITNQYSFIGESGAGIASIADGISTAGTLVCANAVLDDGGYVKFYDDDAAPGTVIRALSYSSATKHISLGVNYESGEMVAVDIGGADFPVNMLSTLVVSAEQAVDCATNGAYLKPRRLSQSAQPTPASGEVLVWRDSDDDKTYVVYNDPDEGVRKVEMT